MCRVLLPATLLCLATVLAAQPLKTADGLAADAADAGLSAVSLDGQALPRVSVEATLLDPRTGEAAQGFTLQAQWTAEQGCLRLEGEVTAPGTEDTVADLVLRVRGVELPLGSMDRDRLLLPAKLLSKLPLVSLRAGGQDRLALAVPPDRLAVHRFFRTEQGVELRFPFGFTRDARPELQMRAPFACIIYRTEPKWHFRSALKGYYDLFPEPFAPFIRVGGGWFFAAPTVDLPNPQHFYYNESGPWGWDLDDERNLGTYPYQESSSWTTGLPGSELPKSYDEAMERFAALERETMPKDWTYQTSGSVDPKASRTGTSSLLADSGDSGVWTGARQSVILKQPATGPFVIRGFSKAEGVTGDQDKDYSIYVDVCYASGGYLFGQCATFATGTHDWQQTELVVTPTEPVAELRVYCLLRGHQGKAWFDDLHIGPVDEPDLNWVSNSGFEEIAKRTDLQLMRDNVCVNSRDEDVVYITDNLSADVGPGTPMNLLRFTLNVDPDLPDTPEKPNVAGRQFEYYDNIFRDTPSVDGAYIDSVSAWCYGILNCRRDHWAANTMPFGYDPQSFRVGAFGRFAMTKYLGALQERYHPSGKAIFTNIHVNQEAFPLYLVSDVPGIESSEFGDQDSTFFYRAASYKKPLLLMNFMNLHGLDKREVAERFHMNAAQWGELPSTGRFVQEAYKLYGDFTHAWMPAIRELAEAGWEPVPLATGGQVERFTEERATYFTIRAPETLGEQTVTFEDVAVAGLGEDLVAMDAVLLCEVPLAAVEGGLSVTLTHGGGKVTVLRISSRQEAKAWLLRRAQRHALDASRVRGKASDSPELQAFREALAQPLPTDVPALVAHVAKLQGMNKLPQAKRTAVFDDDPYRLSEDRELDQCRHALTELIVLATGTKVSLTAPTTGLPGQELKVATTQVGGGGMAAYADEAGLYDGFALQPSWHGQTRSPLRLAPRKPGPHHVLATFYLRDQSPTIWHFSRGVDVDVLPPLSLELAPPEGTADARTFTAKVARHATLPRVVLKATVTESGTVEPPETGLADDVAQANFRIPRTLDGKERTLTVVATDGATVEFARATATFRDEPPLPEGNLALASLGAKVSVDSCYADYTPTPLTDGRTDGAGLHWTEQAWASQDSPKPHWIQVDLPRPATVSGAIIYWSLDGGTMQTSREVEVIGITAEGPKALMHANLGPSAVSSIRFDATTVTGIRIEQPASCGPTGRPGIMWVREVCLAP